jgi:PiT family inorganic phosphate transporter
MGYFFTKLTELICQNIERKKTFLFFKNAQIFGGAAMSFMHGAQDGQKFLGVLILGVFLSEGYDSAVNVSPPLWMMLLVSAVMSFGTSVGGYKIIKTVGLNMVKLENYQGFAADMSAAVCLLISSVFGLPVSTTHTKTTAIVGVGAAKRLSSVNLAVVKDMVLTWIFTFPGCSFIGYIMAKLFFYIFI